MDQTDEASECALLSLCLEDPATLDNSEFSIGLFTGERKELAKWLIQLRVRGQPVNAANVQLLSKSEDMGALASKFSTRQLGGSFALLVERIKDVRVRAKIAAISRKAHDSAFDEGREWKETLAELEKGVVGLRTRGATKGLAYSSDLQEVLDLIAWRNENPDAIRGHPTGLDTFDEAIDGLNPAMLYFLAARPSVGKTALALQLLLHVASATKKRVVFFSAETSAPLIKMRCIAILAGVPVSRTGRAHTPIESRKIIAAAEQFAAMDFVIDDTSSPFLTHTHSVVNRLSQESDLALVAGDYYQLWRGIEGKNYPNKYAELCDVSVGWKTIAKEFNVPALLLAQLARPQQGVYDREQKRTVTPAPQIHELKECGQAEQDADGIWLLHRNQAENSTMAELIIGKNRDGPLDRIGLTFKPETYTFTPA